MMNLIDKSLVVFDDLNWANCNNKSIIDAFNGINLTDESRGIIKNIIETRLIERYNRYCKYIDYVIEYDSRTRILENMDMGYKNYEMYFILWNDIRIDKNILGQSSLLEVNLRRELNKNMNNYRIFFDNFYKYYKDKNIKIDLNDLIKTIENNMIIERFIYLKNKTIFEYLTIEELTFLFLIYNNIDLIDIIIKNIIRDKLIDIITNKTNIYKSIVIELVDNYL